MADDEESFLRTIHAFSGVAGRRIDFIMRKLGLDAFNQVLRRSPVDTGRFRASWRYTVNTFDDTVAPAPKKGAKKVKSSIKKGAPPSGDQLVTVLAANKTVTRKSVIHITNSLVYAQLLDKGSSQQAPNGIIGPTVLSIRLGVIKATRAAQKAVPDA
jgi:hypothetical protein